MNICAKLTQPIPYPKPHWKDHTPQSRTAYTRNVMTVPHSLINKCLKSHLKNEEQPHTHISIDGRKPL